MENLGYLLAAYSIVWAAIFCYVFYLSRKQRKLWREVDSLKKRVGEKAKAR